MVEVKFCGLTRAEDVAEAVRLGARYVGVIFAGGPRKLTAEQAWEVLAPAREQGVHAVGVFGSQGAAELLATASKAGLSVLQLHGGVEYDEARQLRSAFEGELWGVVRVTTVPLDAQAQAVRSVTDALVLDAAVPGKLGGTGVTLDWEALARDPELHRGRLVLAGGLRPSNVALAVSLVRPEVVDVSSGVEVAPGVKDHRSMRAFIEAARGSTLE